jgi:hypothetical protein
LGYTTTTVPPFLKWPYISVLTLLHSIAGVLASLFTSDTMFEWSILVVEEYEYLVKTKTVAQMGLSEFHVLPSFLKDRLQWKDNFTLLARRLTNAPGGPSSNPGVSTVNSE